MIDLYLSGPMSGCPEYNYPEFARVAGLLREAGYMVWSPHENGLPADAEWGQHMRADIAALMQCAAVATLDGYGKSRGALIEINLARDLGMPVEHYEDWLCRRGVVL